MSAAAAVGQLVPIVVAASASAWLALRATATAPALAKLAAETPRPRRFARLAAWTGAALLCLLPMLAAWMTGETNANRIGGLVPYADAGAYYEGAANLLKDGSLGDFNERRPLNAALFAVRLAMAGDDIRGALVLQGLLIAAGAVLAGRAVAATHGRAAGLTAFAVVVLIVSRWGAELTMSEPLGIALGALAAALLWDGAQRRTLWPAVLGTAALSLALFARAGPMLVLPFLAVWLWGRHGRRRPWREQARVLGVAAGAASVGLVSGFLLTALHGDGAANANGNFSVTLYGLAHGGERGYTQFFEDYPAVSEAGDEERTFALAYEKALEQIRAHPDQLALGVARGYATFGSYAWRVATLARLDTPLRFIPLAAAWLLVAVLLARRWRSLRGDPSLTLGAALAAGCLLSVPFVFPDGGIRTFSAVVPLVVVLAIAAFVAPTIGPKVASPTWRAPGALLVVLVAAAHLGPALANRVYPAAPRAQAGECGGRVPVVARLGPGIPHLAIRDTGTTFAPRVTARDLRDGFRPGSREWIAIADEILELGAGEVLALAPVVASGRREEQVAYLFMRSTDIPDRNRWLTVCAQRTRHVNVYVVDRVNTAS